MSRIAIVIRLTEVRKLASGCEYRAKKLARRLGLSLSQFERRFKNEHKVAPQRFLDSLRLEAAAAMLERERMVKIVAIEMKYSRPHFSRSFTNHFGVSPTAYIARLDQRKTGLFGDSPESSGSF
jgi:AraC-like DNA-binding protein